MSFNTTEGGWFERTNSIDVPRPYRNALRVLSKAFSIKSTNNVLNIFIGVVKMKKSAQLLTARTRRCWLKFVIGLIKIQAQTLVGLSLLKLLDSHTKSCNSCLTNT